MDNTQYSKEHFSPYAKRGDDKTTTGTPAAASRKGSAQGVSPSMTSSFVSFFSDVRVRMVLGGLLIGLALYAFVVTVSSFFNFTTDQGQLMNASPETVDAEKVSNIGKFFGALLAHTIFTKWIGVGSFALIFYVAMLGLRLFRAVRFNFLTFTIRCLLVAIVTSIVAGYFTVTNSGLSMFIGGYHGYNINAYLVKYAGHFGAIIFNVLLMIVLISVFLNDIVRLSHKYHQRLLEMKALRTQREKEKQEEDERVRGELDSETRLSKNEKSRKDNKPQPFVFDTGGSSKSGDKPKRSPMQRAKKDEKADVGGMEVTAKEIEEAQGAISDAYDPTAELPNFKMPSISLLKEVPNKGISIDQQEQEENKARIEKTLGDYKITIKDIKAVVGPTVTLYEIIPTDGTRIARIKGLEEDIMMSLAAKGIRIIAPIPGKGSIGIEVPNKEPQMVSIRSVINSRKFQESKYILPMALGATIANEVYVADLAKMPHLLVAGATGQGKSVGLNTIIASLLYKKHPSELKFVLIDPKMVEFSLYSRIENHYLAKLPDADDAIVTDMDKVVMTLKSLCIEMDNRYELLRDANVRSLEEYNAKFVSRRLNPEKGHKYLPYIVIIVDEFADLIMTAGKEVETPICRIAQKARAVGMHMIIATQRPSTNVITGVIKANFPGRMAFRVSQMVDSRTILDRPGAQHLIGKGDMLLFSGNEIDRIQCAFISTEEVEAICGNINGQAGFIHPYLLPEYVPTSEGAPVSGGGPGFGDRDPLFDECARYIVNSGVGSTSSLQRHFQTGYTRAGRIMDQMEAAGIVGPSTGGKPRQILVDIMTLEQILGN